MNTPYPAGTRAKGWRFELDHERIRQSDTWALATPELRPWLLMLWMVAWEQTPCGSLPDDDALIAARIGMAPRSFVKAKSILLRGWQKADDGRLYHSTLIERVLEMIAYREKETARRSRNRAGHTPNDAGIPPRPSVVPRDIHGTGQHIDAGHGGTETRDDAVDHAGRTPPEPEPVPEPAVKAKSTRGKPRSVPLPDGFGVSERVRLWAEQHGHGRLSERLEHFVGYAQRSGKTYADWDAAFMSAIREDWAKIGNAPPARGTGSFYDTPSFSSDDVLRAQGLG